MAGASLYTFLYAWVNQVLNTEASLGIEIIQSHQDAPEPEATTATEPRYIAIAFAPSRSRIGRPSAGEPNVSGVRKLINDWELMVEIWEVNGDGSLLQKLVDSTDRGDIMDLWTTNKFALMETNEIQNLPRRQENKWRRECMMELRINTPEETSETSGFIDDIEYTGTIPAQGRAGNIIITNT